MDIKNPKPGGDKDSGLDFVVMPRLEKNRPLPAPEKLIEQAAPRSGRKTLAIAAGILAIILLALAGYYTYAKWSQAGPEPEPDPAITIQDEALNADADNDGLGAQQEKAQSTDPQKPDSDGDGLADGDEINVYGSDPLLFDTDSDKYDDGQEVAGGYSPVSNSAVQATLSERQTWLIKSVEFGLHEPTLATLKSRARGDGTNAGDQTLYVNDAYRYSIEYPGILALREMGDSRVVGLYIAGTEPEETITNEPIVIAMMGEQDKETLKDWVESQFSPDSYETLSDIAVNSLSGVQMKGVDNETSCLSDWTFFSQGDAVIALTLSCNDPSALSGLYADIINSFKFR